MKSSNIKQHNKCRCAHTRKVSLKSVKGLFQAEMPLCIHAINKRIYIKYKYNYTSTNHLHSIYTHFQINTSTRQKEPSPDRIKKFGLEGFPVQRGFRIWLNIFFRNSIFNPSQFKYLDILLKYFCESSFLNVKLMLYWYSWKLCTLVQGLYYSSRICKMECGDIEST